MSPFSSHWYQSLSPNIQGLCWLMLSMPCFQAMNVMLKETSEDLAPVEVMFFRNLFGFLVLLPWLLRGGWAVLRTRAVVPNIFRAGCHLSGMVLWVYTLTLLPLATASALMFTSPLFVAVAAVLFFGEPSRMYRWLATAIGFAGTLIIIRPDMSGVHLGVITGLGGAILLGGSKLLTKVVTRRDSTLSTVFYLNLFMCLLALIPTIFVWKMPTAGEFGIFACLGLVGGLAHFCFTKAIAVADLTTLQPFEFVILIWAAAIGYMLYQEIPDQWVIIGGAIVIAGATLVAHDERNLAEAARRRSASG